jgi:hypothetical protein
MHPIFQQKYVDEFLDPGLLGIEFRAFLGHPLVFEPELETHSSSH